MLRADAISARAARRFLRDVLQGWQCGYLIDTTLLAANEVVTNAILHARSEVRVAVRLLPNAVRVEVDDTSGTLPVRRPMRDDATGGRGLALLDALTARWGVESMSVGKRVWFEVPR